MKNPRTDKQKRNSIIRLSLMLLTISILGWIVTYTTRPEVDSNKQEQLQ